MMRNWMAAAALALASGLAAAQEQTPAEPAPTPAVAEPAIGLAEFVGAETCLSCHEDKKSFEDNLHAPAFKNAKGIAFEKSCETCHGPGSLHAGAAGDKSNKDFWTIKNPTKGKALEASATCLQCHQGGKRMHWQGSAHELKNVSCASCHSMHDVKANKGASPLLAKGTDAETCYLCHADKKAQIQKSAHMPLKEGKMSCVSCHNPHGTTSEKLMAKASVTETCFQCHQDKRGPFLWEHPPVRENCLNCHNPHGSHNDKMLVTKAPLLCQRCHIATRHPSSLYDLTALNKDSNRLLNRACANCHTRVHGSNHPSGKTLLR